MSTIHLPEISNESGDVIELGSGNTYILDVYTDGDFDGTQNKHSLIKSDTYGSTVILDLSVVGNITVRYCDFSNINIINGTVTFIGGDNYNQIVTILKGNSVIYLDSSNNLIINKRWIMDTITWL